MRFVDALLIVVLLALGISALMMSLLLWYTSGHLETYVAIDALIAVGLLLSAYGIWKGKAWGYLVAATISVLSLLGNLLLGQTLAAILDALIVVLALYAHFTKKPLPITKPTSPVPPPTTPVATTFIELKKERKYIRRRV